MMEQVKIHALSAPSLEPRVSTTNSDTWIHMDFFGENYSDSAVPVGDVKGRVVFLEYDEYAPFCNIKPLGDIPNVELAECVEIYDTESYEPVEKITLKDALTCPCVLHATRIYGLDLQKISWNDFDSYSCKTCSCCNNLTSFTRKFRYDISPLYQTLPTFRPDPIVLYNLERRFPGERVQRVLYDLSVNPKSDHSGQC